MASWDTLLLALVAPAAGAAKTQLVLLVTRAVPLAVYSASASRFGTRTRLLTMTLFAVAALGAEQFSPGTLEMVGRTVAGMAYYALTATLVYHLQPTLTEARVGGLMRLVLAFTLFLLLPALVLPSFILPLGVLVLGWDFALSAYSYWKDSQWEGTRPSLGECLFFMLVNPTLVYPDRGQWERRPRPDLGGGLRLLVGLTMMTGGSLLVAGYPIAARAVQAAGVPQLARFGISGVLFFFATYWLAAGLAHIHIGLFRQVGYWLPECYRCPLLATGPADFWRRWNIYVMTWARRYLFDPLVLWLVRLRRRLWPSATPGAVQAAAVVLTFVSMGVLHDLYTFVETKAAGATATALFSFSAVIILIWEVTARHVRRHQPAGKRVGPTRGLFARAYFGLGLIAASGAMSML
ncbi:MAG: hypothetical protein OXR73_12630 [Myxococcales bacterium]|nr:hypothetical protein [Myxococcales bacterium]